MIRTMLAAGASALALTLAAPVAAQDETDTPLPTMSFGEWGFDPAYISQDIEPEVARGQSAPCGVQPFRRIQSAS